MHLERYAQPADPTPAERSVQDAFTGFFPGVVHTKPQASEGASPMRWLLPDSRVLASASLAARQGSCLLSAGKRQAARRGLDESAR